MAIPTESQPDPHDPDIPPPRPNIKVEQHVDTVSQGGTVFGVVQVADSLMCAACQTPSLALQSFTYDDRTKYGGRSHEIAAAVAKLTDPASPQPLLFVTGASGVRKVFICASRTGACAERHYANFTVEHAVFRPSANPLAGLGDALWRQLVCLHRPRRGYAHHLTLFCMNRLLRQINIIVIDQFEELFTQSAAQPRDALFKCLTNLPPFTLVRSHFIATLRADYLPQLFAIPSLFESR